MIEDHPDRRAFFSRLNAEQYERELVPRIFRPWARQLLDRLPAVDGPVLDLACGTGALSRELVQRQPQLELHGLDLSDDMLAIARQQCPQVNWRQGNALELPWADQHFALVMSQQGLQFVPERPAVLREIRRVLRPGGHLLAACWQPAADNGAYAALLELAEQRGWDGLAGFIRQIFSWPLAALSTDLEACGFHIEQAETRSLPVDFPSPAAFLAVFSRVPPLQPDWDALSEKERSACEQAFHHACRPWLQADGSLRFDMCSGMVRARKAA